MTARAAVEARAKDCLSALTELDGVEGVLLYGSVARGDAEPHSDVDVLILCGAARKRPILELANSSVLRHNGKVSVTIYSRRELRFLARARSLFLLHLSRESIILRDSSGGFLESLLAGFTPKPSYAEDFRKALTLLDPLQTIVRGAPNQLHRLAHAYSLFRIFGVYLLAERGVYEFSKERMSEDLCALYPGISPHVHTLSPLRRLNNGFFSPYEQPAEPLSGVGDKDARACVSALLGLTGTGTPVHEKSYSAAVEDFAQASAVARGRLDYRLRTWFLLLAYDGLNIFCERRGLPPLTGFSGDRLTMLASPDLPHETRNAACEVLSYMRAYPLKYFLDRGRGLDAPRARGILSGLARLPG